MFRVISEVEQVSASWAVKVQRPLLPPLHPTPPTPTPTPHTASHMATSGFDDVRHQPLHKVYKRIPSNELKDGECAPACNGAIKPKGCN